MYSLYYESTKIYWFTIILQKFKEEKVEEKEEKFVLVSFWINIK